MKIGIDIDDTTVITVKSMIKYADLYDTQILGRKGTNGNLGLIQNRYYLKVLYGWDEKTKFDFFDTYYKNVLEECTPMLNAGKTIKKLKDEGLWIAAADMDGQTFYEQNLTGALGLVIGSEGFGISRLVKQNCDFTVKMPMIGNVTSLNASVAAGILLYEIFKQRTGNK